jgi:hypothetical protein
MPHVEQTDRPTILGQDGETVIIDETVEGLAVEVLVVPDVHVTVLIDILCRDALSVSAREGEDLRRLGWRDA